jgi:hypothetical protein
LQDHSVHPGASNVVGKLQWFGRAIGNHHIGVGKIREVDILKGANMSYRRKAIHNLRFDDRLKGSGAQVDNDMAFSLAVKRRGWKLIYDPQVSIDHFLGTRLDEDQRKSFNSTACENSSYNHTLVVLTHISRSRRIFFLMWTFLIGTRHTYGFLQLFRMFPREGYISLMKLYYSLKGKLGGCSFWLLSK